MSWDQQRLQLAGGLLLTLTLASAAAAQTYRARVNGTDNYAVVISETSGRVGVHIQLAPIGSDDCNRPWYLDGTIVRTMAGQSGTFSGTMKRCTNRTLKDECERQGKPIGENYDKPATGVFRNESFGLVLEVTYQAEKWNKTDCKFEKQEHGSDTAIITLVTTGDTRDPRIPTVGDLFRGVAYGTGGGSPMR